ncbi:hypothetical protein GDO81_018925 [Engystomops pustulosus]|uniref:Uncharacterized protein n=1 Tax=Engystomops pustulosus TaxID=76066 RepID=A0AAV6YKZ3_ENGPU|nr:hypothetical protein GDO81_018925 [Engystomops pustulosus]
MHFPPSAYTRVNRFSPFLVEKLGVSAITQVSLYSSIYGIFIIQYRPKVWIHLIQIPYILEYKPSFSTQNLCSKTLTRLILESTKKIKSKLT